MKKTKKMNAKRRVPVFSGPSGRKRQAGVRAVPNDHMDFTSSLPMGQLPDVSFEEAVAQMAHPIGMPTPGKDQWSGTYKENLIHDRIRESPTLHDHIRKFSQHEDDPYNRTKLGVTQDQLEEDIEVISHALETRGVVLEKPQGSSLHHFFDFCSASPAWQAWRAALEWDDGVEPADLYESFIVEHDWSRMLAGKMDQGDFPLPYQGLCFEFRITGLRVLFLVSTDETQMASTASCKLLVGVNKRWHINADRFYFEEGRLFSHTLKKPIDGIRDSGWPEKFLLMIGDQIRAICVMLDAKVVEREVIRAPDKLNAQKAKQGKTKMKDFHVVNLSRRFRAAPSEEAHEPSNRKPPRMHLRRGHWRHFANQTKTWIAWMWVGDEGNGFVDKEYRL